MRPELADRLDQYLWELRFKVHTGLTRREIIDEIEYVRALYQSIKAGGLTMHLHSISPQRKKRA